MENKNYIAEVAKILGVEMGEVFTVNETGVQYCFSNDGLIGSEGDNTSPIIVEALLVGIYSIKRTSWKPSYRETFYFVAPNGMVLSDIWYNHAFDLMAHKLGNCYRAKEEAETNRDKWVAFYASDEIVEV